MSLDSPISITGFGALSRLGTGLEDHARALKKEPEPFQTLGEAAKWTASSSSLDRATPAAWIEPRGLLIHRKWSPLSMAAVHVSREALARSGWSDAERSQAAIFFANSRGTLDGWLNPRPGRRPFPLMSAANSLSSEPAAAIAAELGIHGPSQTFASGCCAGLDALGMAALWLRAGLSPRALVVAAELPLVPQLLEAYRGSRLLAGPQSTDGLVPAEAAAAICLEGSDSARSQLLSYRTVTDAAEPFGTLRDPAIAASLLQSASGFPDLVLTHASGPLLQATAENEAIATHFPGIPTLALKPWTGHAIAASGLLEIVLSSLHPAVPRPVIISKITSALGGKHSILTFRLA